MRTRWIDRHDLARCVVEQGGISAENAGRPSPKHGPVALFARLQGTQRGGNISYAPFIDRWAQEDVGSFDVVMFSGMGRVRGPGGGPHTSWLQRENNAALQ